MILGIIHPIFIEHMFNRENLLEKSFQQHLLILHWQMHQRRVNSFR